MKTLKVGPLELVIVGVAAIVLIGCSPAGSGPGTSEVAKAMVTMTSATTPGGAAKMDSATYTGNSYTYSNTVGGGSVAVGYTLISGTPGAGPWSASGTITYVNWYDSLTGYTINGTVNVTGSVSGTTYPMTVGATMNASLTLSGGKVSSIACNISETVVLSDAVTMKSYTASGTVTADGFNYQYTSSGIR
jgi:hypothetical protein